MLEITRNAALSYWRMLCRWDTAANAGISWVGQDIPAVQIDKFGKFPYVLVKLSDRMAGNKLIVRGKNGRSEPQLVSAVSKEVHHLLEAGMQAHSSALATCMVAPVPFLP